MNKFLNDLEKFTLKIRELQLKNETELVIEFMKNYNWERITLEKRTDI
ncbi:hypothetical protein H3N56_02595 [Cetobacterium sp. 2A]|nr:hypothetical protein [Cetobacterium sp. 2A]MBC2855382.1 hypothetical protein [Cetobacterium sp. 2A]